jgi:NADPH:quinone reductase
MKSVYTDGRGGIRLREVDAPLTGRGEIGIASVCSLISAGTELHYAREAALSHVEIPLGYCAAGVVETVGPGCEGLRAGDRVIAMGWGHAVHAERIAVPQRLCARVRDDVPLDRAVVGNLAATALHALHRAGPQPPDARVLVVGAGLVGQLVARLARLAKADVALVEKIRTRLEIAQAAGFPAFATSEDVTENVSRHFGNRGVDVIYLCGGGQDGFPRELLEAVMARAPDGSRRGIVVCVGRFPVRFEANAALGNVDFRISARCGAGYRDDAYVRGITTYAAPPGEATVDENLQRCLQLIEDGELDVADLVTHRVPFDDAPRAYRLLDDAELALGVVLDHTMARNDATDGRTAHAFDCAS